MKLPSPDVLVVRARALSELDTRLVPDVGAREYTARPGDVWVYDDGAGNHCVLWSRGDRWLLKAFDHESAQSRWMREPQVPDPAVVRGMPKDLAALLAEPVDDLDGADRTFCAWWDGARWTTRGAGSGPVEGFLLDAQELVRRLAAQGLRADEEQITALLAGQLAADAVTIEPIVEAVVPGPPGWTMGDPFVLQVLAARKMRSVPLLKLVRDLTGRSVGDLQRALADGEPLLELVLQRHGVGQVEKLAQLGLLLDALAGEGGARFLVAVPGDPAVEADEAMVRGMLGTDTLWLEPGGGATIL